MDQRQRFDLLVVSQTFYDGIDNLPIPIVRIITGRIGIGQPQRRKINCAGVLFRRAQEHFVLHDCLPAYKSEPILKLGKKRVESSFELAIELNSF
jgi:hypothetical protein